MRTQGCNIYVENNPTLFPSMILQFPVSDPSFGAEGGDITVLAMSIIAPRNHPSVDSGSGCYSAASRDELVWFRTISAIPCL
jgi:hypothetical protein